MSDIPFDDKRAIHCGSANFMQAKEALAAFELPQILAHGSEDGHAFSRELARPATPASVTKHRPMLPQIFNIESGDLGLQSETRRRHALPLCPGVYASTGSSEYSGIRFPRTVKVAVPVVWEDGDMGGMSAAPPHHSNSAPGPRP